MTAPALLPTFRSRLQGELLALILADHTRSWTLSELAERTGGKIQAVSKEIRRLEDSHLLSVEHAGRTKLLTANKRSPYIGPLTELVLMSFGPPLVVAEAFAGVAGIDQIYIYGSWARRYHGEAGAAPNDIDLLVLGTPDRDELFDAAGEAQIRLGREVNVTLRRTAEWATATDGFAEHVKSSPLVGIV